MVYITTCTTAHRDFFPSHDSRTGLSVSKIWLTTAQCKLAIPHLIHAKLYSVNDIYEFINLLQFCYSLKHISTCIIDQNKHYARIQKALITNSVCVCVRVYMLDGGKRIIPLLSHCPSALSSWQQQSLFSYTEPWILHCNNKHTFHIFSDTWQKFNRKNKKKKENTTSADCFLCLTKNNNNKSFLLVLTPTASVSVYENNNNIFKYSIGTKLLLTKLFHTIIQSSQ